MRPGSSVAGVADPGRGAERLSERLFGMGPDAEKRIRSRVLRDVAWGPSVETGASVPGYSGGLAACAVVSYSDLLCTQYVSLPLHASAMLVNAVFNYPDSLFGCCDALYWRWGGYGAVFVDGSNSTNPSEPGINHFNSELDVSSGGLTLQAKIGVRAKISSNWSVFTEFRHIYIGSTDFTSVRRVTRVSICLHQNGMLILENRTTTSGFPE